MDTEVLISVPGTQETRKSQLLGGLVYLRVEKAVTSVLQLQGKVPGGSPQRRPDLQAALCGSWPQRLGDMSNQHIVAGALLILSDKRTFTLIIIYEAASSVGESYTVSH